VRVISISSGKGGVGKTLTTVNFALAARKMGLSVLILDGDLGLANVDIVMGLQARYNIRDVLDGTVSLQDVIVEGPMGIQVIPSGSGISSLASLSYVQKSHILGEIGQLSTQPDLLLIDTGAGISSNVTHFNQAADKIVVVTTPEPHAMTDAYALTKVLSEEFHISEVHLLVNQAHSAAEGINVYERIADVARRFLKAKINYIGHVPSDASIPRAVMARSAVGATSTATIAGQAWNQIARNTISDLIRSMPAKRAESVWSGLLWNEHTAVASGQF